MPPEQNDDLSSLGKARDRLYAPGDVAPEPPQVFSAPTTEVPRSWRDSLSPRTLGEAHHVRFASRFFIAAIAFFILAVGVSVLLFYTGSNAVSAENVELTVQGPTTIAGGEPVPLSLVITNKNPATITGVTLEVDFPEGTRSAEDVTKLFPRYTEELEDLSPGETIERSVSAVLFGSPGAQPVIRLAVSFRTDRSNSVFARKLEYPISISTAPLSVSIDSVSETVSGKPFSIKATVRSNATQRVEGVVLRAQYPAGYAPISSSVTAVGTTFPLGAFEPGASKTVTLTGTLTGQDKDERVFHFAVGTAKSANDPTLAVVYMNQEALVTIAAPFLTTNLTINGSSAANPAVAPGSSVSVKVSWANALSVPLTNASIEVALSGSALNPESVNAPRGFYRSSDRTVVYSRDTEPMLASLASGDSGSATFTFYTLSNAPRNSSVTLSVSVAGDRVGQTGVPERVTSTLEKTVKLVSAVTFSAASLKSSGPITNSGPVPPMADKETAYTVRWSIINAGNDLADAVVTASLPQYVGMGVMTSPADGSITFEPSTRTVRWRVGDIGGGTTRTAYFQVLLTPSITQRGTAPNLTSASTFTAFDRYAQVQVTLPGKAVTTETPEDPGYTSSKGTVQ